MGSDIHVEVLRDAEFGDWDRLVAESPGGSIYSATGYLDALCRAAGGRFVVLGARFGDELAGGVALYERTSRYGPYVAPRRLLYYNGLVVRRYETRYPSEQTARYLKIAGATANALADRHYAWCTLCFRSTVTDARPFLLAGWTAIPQWTYVVDVRDPALLFSRIEQNLRRLVRRCERDGFSVIEDEAFDDFLRLHALTMSRKDQEQYLESSAFRRYFDQLRAAGACKLYNARTPAGRVAASQLVLLGPGGLTHSVAAAADPELSKTGVSAFLRWRVFEALGRLGYAANDLTDASLNSVTHFKSQLGGDLTMFLQLDAPRSLACRVGGAAAAALRQARGAADRLGERLAR